jgi:hypothetical protein
MIIVLVIIALLSGCATPDPPHIMVVKDKAQLMGHLGMYWKGTHTIYLAPGANEDVFWHEWAHAMGDDLGENPLIGE